MKNNYFNLGIASFLLVFFVSFTAIQAQIPGSDGVRDSVYVWDDFDIEGDELTDTNGNSGEGWTDNWTYQTGFTSGVLTGDGSITGIDGGFGISRYLINPILLGTSNFYASFVVNKTETGDFRIAGVRADGIERYAVGVNANGGLYANIANAQRTSEAGVVKNDSTYLVIAKWVYSGEAKMSMVAYKAGESIPADEPAVGEWDMEETGGKTGVQADYIRIVFSSEEVKLYDFKVGDTWNSVADSTLLIDPSNVEAIAISTSAIMLKWNDNAFNKDGFKIYMDGTEIGTVAANVAQFEVTGLTIGTTYNFGVTAFKGSFETAAAELEYLFELDETPPTVVGTIPEDSDNTVDETSDIVIKFSELMNTASVEGAITVDPALVNPQYTWDGDTILTISADDLLNSTLYTVTVGTTASDLVGNNMESEFEFTFTTIEKDITPPTIVSINPPDNSTDVLITSNIVVSFSEAMDKASVEGAITIDPALTNPQFIWSADSVIRVKGDKLANSTQYTVTIGTGALDLKGNALVAEEVVSFTTGASGLMLYDDFNISDGVLTNSNGSSGQGWIAPWSYAENPGAVNALNGYISGGTYTNIVRPLSFPYKINATTYYMSFLAVKSPEGAFDILGGRLFNGVYQWRTGVGVNTDGSMRFKNHEAAPVISSTSSGTFEDGTTYLVVFKQTPKQKQQVKLFKAGDPVTEPGDGEWDFELPQGNTGVSMDYVGILFQDAAANIDELKVGYTWDEVSNTTISDITEFPLAAPTKLKIIANSDSTAELEWRDNSVIEDGFKIYQNGTEIVTLDVNSNLYELSDLTEGETYTISVNAFKADAQAASAELTFVFEFDAENYVDTRIESFKTTTAPVIDGTVDDVWANAVKHPVKKYHLEDEEAPIDENDYQSSWSVMWDDNKLYFLFEVIDDVLILDDGSGTNIGSSDGFEIPMANAANGLWTLNRLNLISPAEGDTSLYMHQGMIAFLNAEKAFSLTDKGYNIELSMVLRDFDDGIGLFVEGYQFRIDVRYNESDIVTIRKTQYTWTDKNDEDWVWDNTNTLGTVTLVEGEDPGTGIVEQEKVKMPELPFVYLSDGGTVLNIMNYNGAAKIFNITGRQIMSITDAAQSVNISNLVRGIYIVKTDVGSIKFVK